MPEKPLRWVGPCRDDLRAWPDEARRHAGHQLHRVQLGLMPEDWKPLASVGQGVCEIRVRTTVAYRVFYIAQFEEAVYVLHVFEKRTQKTAKRDLEVGRQRLAEVLRERRER